MSSIGRESEGATRTTAEEFISKTRHDAREGRLNLPKRRKVALTLASAAPLYIDRLKEGGGKNIERKEQQLDLKPSTVNRELATLSHLLNKAVEWGWIDRPPAKVRKLKEGSGRIVYLTAEQADALLEAAKADQNRQIYRRLAVAIGRAKASLDGARIKIS